MSDTSGTYKIRPAGRHILTIGRDLIQDSYAAVVELVKNAYDADSPDVQVAFHAKPDYSGYSVVIEDHGHGMSRDTVINKWMVPSTRDKFDRHTSPAGRIMQGRKGIGRYAASILGSELLLETTTAQGEKTTAFVQWADFEKAQYLDDVEILIETSYTAKVSGTRLTITGDSQFLADWNQAQFRKLQFELKKLMPPVNVSDKTTHSGDEFRIHLTVNGFNEVQNINEVVEPYPIFDLFDYKISGKIDASGHGVLLYSQQKARNSVEEQIPFENGKPTGCGELVFDIRVYDREKEAIDSLIGRGLKDESGNYVGKLQARQLLNEYNGIGVYRNGFRIRPLGDADFDWLKLNEQRVQNPSLRVGSNQVIGYVQIQPEDISELIEKSARDGLRENAAFDCLKTITKAVIAKLEERRFEYRRKAGLSRPVFKTEQAFEGLFSFEELKKTVRSKLATKGVDKETTEEVIGIISEDEDDKNKVAEELRQAIAIYQGQATLGKIINVVLHEGRRPLGYFRNQIPRIQKKTVSFKSNHDVETANELATLAEGIGTNADSLVNLFQRIDPLAAGKRTQKHSLNLKKIISNSLFVFENDLRENNIEIKVEVPDGLTYSCWQQDIVAVFVNLIDNSLYWMTEKKSSKREISITAATNGANLAYIDYRDTGPGIEPNLITSGVIFEPQFSTKPQGTGLGLAIAGEAAMRNNLELEALESDTGAYFRLQPKQEETDG
jgi:signal transduction histidine kinase